MPKFLREKAEILANADKQVEKINAMYRRGFISAAEKSKRFIQIWNGATDDVTTALKNDLGKYNPIFMMADSGARGSYQPDPSAGRYERSNRQYIGFDHRDAYQS